MCILTGQIRVEGIEFKPELFIRYFDAALRAVSDRENRYYEIKFERCYVTQIKNRNALISCHAMASRATMLTILMTYLIQHYRFPQLDYP